MPWPLWRWIARDKVAPPAPVQRNFSGCVSVSSIAAFAAAPFTTVVVSGEADRTECLAAFVANIANVAAVGGEDTVTLIEGQTHWSQLPTESAATQARGPAVYLGSAILTFVSVVALRGMSNLRGINSRNGSIPPAGTIDFKLVSGSLVFLASPPRSLS
jgi:hypothetical protein